MTGGNRSEIFQQPKPSTAVLHLHHHATKALNNHSPSKISASQTHQWIPIQGQTSWLTMPFPSRSATSEFRRSQNKAGSQRSKNFGLWKLTPYGDATIDIPNRRKAVAVTIHDLTGIHKTHLAPGNTCMNSKPRWNFRVHAGIAMSCIWSLADWKCSVSACHVATKYVYRIHFQNLEINYSPKMKRELQ